MKKRNIADEVLAGLNQATAYMEGKKTKTRSIAVHVPQDVEVKAIRSRLHVTQAEFARRFALPLPSLRKWEQGNRQPDSATRAYLTVIERNSKIIEKTLLKG